MASTLSSKETVTPPKKAKGPFNEEYFKAICPPKKPPTKVEIPRLSPAYVFVVSLIVFWVIVLIILVVQRRNSLGNGIITKTRIVAVVVMTIIVFVGAIVGFWLLSNIEPGAGITALVVLIALLIVILGYAVGTMVHG